MVDYRLESGQIIGSDGNIYCLADLLGAENARGVCENPKSYTPRTGNIIGADGNVYNIVDLIAARNARLADSVHYTEDSGKSNAEKAQARTNIGAGTYSKPSGGIPASDIASGVIPDISGKADKITVTAADNGKFMRVVNGAWAAVTVPDANGVSF